LLAILLLLLFLSFFFSLSETAFVSLSKFKIKKISYEKHRFTNFFETWLRQPQYLLTTILVGNNVVNVLFSGLATYTVLNTFTSLNRELAEISTWVGATLIIIIFGEIIPKTLSRRYPEKIVFLSPYLLTFFSKLFTPVNSLVNYLTEKFFYSFLPSSHLLTREEIKILIRDIFEEGAVDSETGKMLTKTVELCELRVEQIMTPWEKVESLNIDEEASVLVDRLVESGRTRMPIYRGDEENVIGYIYVKDLLRFWQKEEKISIEKIIRPIYKFSGERKVSELLEEFKKGTVYLALVVDSSSKRVLGLVTWEDILEEIIGEILDDYDLRKRWFR